MNTLSLPLSPEVVACCQIMDCQERATWRCHPQGSLRVSIALCPTHKQQAEQGEALREQRSERNTPCISC